MNESAADFGAMSKPTHRAVADPTEISPGERAADIALALENIRGLNERAEALLRTAPAQALTTALKALDAAREAGISETVPLSRFIQGTALSLLTDFGKARETLEQAAWEAQNAGLAQLANRCMNGLAVIFEFTGEFGRGLQTLENCLSLARQTHDAAAEIRALCNLGNIFVAMKEHDRAHELFSAALALAERENNTLLEVISAGSFAESLSAANRIEESEALLARIIPLAERDGHTLQLGFFLKMRGSNLLAKGVLDAAERILIESESIARTVEDRNLLCDVLLCLADVSLRAKKLDAAQGILDEVVPLASAVGLRLYEARAFGLQAVVAAARGQFERAYLSLAQEVEVERLLAAETTSRKTQVLTVEFEVERHRQVAAVERDRSALLDLSNQKLNEANQRLQAALDQLEHTASHDLVTGLFNRRKFQELADAAFEQSRHQGGTCALCFIDLDDFKSVNDSWGHHVGDALLIEFAQRLKNAVEPADVVARVGGDEFVVLLGALANPGDLDRVLARLRQVWSTPFSLEVAYHASASIGVAVSPIDGSTRAELQRCADARMYEDKWARSHGEPAPTRRGATPKRRHEGR